MAERRREELNRYIWHLTHAAPEVAEVSGLSCGLFGLFGEGLVWWGVGGRAGEWREGYARA